MSDQWELAIQKLIRQTTDGEITWCETRQIADIHPELNVTGPAYVAEVEGKRLAIFEHRYRVFGEPQDWSSNIEIQFVNDAGENLFSWPERFSRFDLLEAIREQNAGANEFLSQYLASTS